MGEPRIHFAIVCASIGSPRLLDEADIADKLDQLLVGNTRDFFARPQNLPEYSVHFARGIFVRPLILIHQRLRVHR